MMTGFDKPSVTGFDKPSFLSIIYLCQKVVELTFQRCELKQLLNIKNTKRRLLLHGVRSGMVLGKSDHTGRSYNVHTERGVYRRNRAHLSLSKESAFPDSNKAPDPQCTPEHITESANDPQGEKLPEAQVAETQCTPVVERRTRTRVIKSPTRFADFIKY